MSEKLDLSPEEIKDKRRYERYELYLPVHFKLFNDDGIPFVKENIEGFSRNYSKQGLLIEFSYPHVQLNPDDLINAIIKGDVLLPIVDAPIPFEGEIKWIRSYESSKYFIGVFISYVDDFHRLQLLQFAKKVNRRSKIIMSLIFTLFITITLALMAFFSFNAYIDKLTSRQRQIYKELNDRVGFLTEKLNDIASNVQEKE